MAKPKASSGGSQAPKRGAGGRARAKASAKPKLKKPKARAARKATARRVDPARVALMYQKLRERHPDAHCELEHENPFQLLIATVLSAQSTDVMVNRITPGLFERWPDAAALAEASQGEVETALARIGMYRQKAKNIIGLSRKLVAEHGGAVPRSLSELIELPGVGRKTANVVLGVAFNASEGVVVDTHVQRISQRLGWTKHEGPPEIERDLMTLFPQREWDMVSHTLIFHGRRICTARAPACAACPLSELCPSAFHAERVGRKPQRIRR
jgi:endonuclease-3